MDIMTTSNLKVTGYHLFQLKHNLTGIPEEIFLIQTREPVTWSPLWTGAPKKKGGVYKNDLVQFYKTINYQN